MNKTNLKLMIGTLLAHFLSFSYASMNPEENESSQKKRLLNNRSSLNSKKSINDLKEVNNCKRAKIEEKPLLQKEEDLKAHILSSLSEKLVVFPSDINPFSFSAIKKEPDVSDDLSRRAQANSLHDNSGKVIIDYDLDLSTPSIDNKKRSSIDDYDLALLIPDIDEKTKSSTYLNRGIAKYALRQYPQAINDYDLALLTPDIDDKTKSSTYLNRGIAKYALHQYPQAINDHDLALLIPDINDRTKFLAYFYLGFSQSKIGQYQKAIDNLEEALKFKNHLKKTYISSIYTQLGLLYKHI